MRFPKSRFPIRIIVFDELVLIIYVSQGLTISTASLGNIVEAQSCPVWGRGPGVGADRVPLQHLRRAVDQVHWYTRGTKGGKKQDKLSFFQSWNEVKQIRTSEQIYRL